MQVFIGEPVRIALRLAGLYCSIVLAVAPCAAAGQVSGAVRDEASGAPVPGAVVTALARNDSVVGRVITSRQGRFAFALPVERVARVRVVRIGYRPGTADVGGAGALDIALTPLSWALATVEVGARRDCPIRADAAHAAALWTEAQGALLAAVVSREAAPAVIRVVRYYRTIDESRGRVDSQSVSAATIAATRVFAAGQTPSFLAQRGYVIANERSYAIYGPDEEVLLDDSFARTHCFRIAHDAGHVGQVGVAFEPAQGRDSLTDLAGTLWLDSARAELRSVQYAYTDLHVAGVSSDGAGGGMTFATAANGIPLMVSWWLREPLRPAEGQFARRTPRGGGTGVGVLMRLRVETGAQLAHATWADGTSWSTSLPTVAGIVLDRATRAPRAGVPVRLLNAGRVALSDSSGRFLFDELVPGPYIFAVEDTMLAVFRDVLRIEQPRITGARLAQSLAGWIERRNHVYDDQPLVQAIDVDSGPNPPITVELPAMDDAFRRKCGSELKSAAAGVLAAWVIRGAGAASGATLAVTWQEGSTRVERSVRTDESGRAILCGVPRGGSVALSSTGRGAPAHAMVQMRADRLVTLGVLQVMP